MTSLCVIRVVISLTSHSLFLGEPFSDKKKLERKNGENYKENFFYLLSFDKGKYWKSCQNFLLNSKKQSQEV